MRHTYRLKYTDYDVNKNKDETEITDSSYSIRSQRACWFK